MKLIVGLGNPGEKYQKTRHNLGFMVLDKLVRDYEPVEKTAWEDNKKFKAELVEINWKNERVILAKPQTFMNNSGLAVQLLTTYYKLLTTDIWVLHDDIDLPLGKIKIRASGGSAGHKGVDSIIKSLATDKFIRFRLGIGKPFKGKIKMSQGRRSLEKVDEYVLSTFLRGETHQYKELVKKGAKALEVALEKNLEAAMNRFNAK